MNIIIGYPLLLILIVDLRLHLSGAPTISERFQKLLPSWADYILWVAVFIVVTIALKDKAWIGWLAMLLSHVLWPNKELY